MTGGARFATALVSLALGGGLVAAGCGGDDPTTGGGAEVGAATLLAIGAAISSRA